MITAYSFPLGKETWIISVTHTLDPDQDIDLDFEGSNVFKDFQADNDLVKNIVIGLGIYEPRSYGEHSKYVQKIISHCEQTYKKLENIYIVYDKVCIYPENVKTAKNIKFVELDYFFIAQRPH